MDIKLPKQCLVLMIGPAGSGKTTFAQKHFLNTEVVSSDHCRELVADDAENQSVSKAAFEVVRLLVRRRLEAGKLTVVDATNLGCDARRPFFRIAADLDCPVIGVMLRLPHALCVKRQQQRTRRVQISTIRRQINHLNQDLPKVDGEGFAELYQFEEPEQVDAVRIIRDEPYLKREEHGPFDIIGDIHGCFDETLELLDRLGWRIEDKDGRFHSEHPQQRKVVFLGDLVDRGPNSPDVVRLVMHMVQDGAAFCVAGNHDVKLMRWLDGGKVKMTHGLAETVAQLEGKPQDLLDEIRAFGESLPSHLVLDQGRLVVAHAGLPEEKHARNSKAVWAFALFGHSTGEVDAKGFPIRYPWANDYRGEALVAYGHTPITDLTWVNNTICLDTGCVFGGALSALRYPERELVSVPARHTYYTPVAVANQGE